MVAEIALNYILANTSAVTTLVGSGSSARIYYGLRSQTSTLPAISIETDGIEPTDQKPDTITTGAGSSRLDVEDVLVFSYGATYTAANALAQVVRAALDKKSGGTYDSISVQSIQYMGEDYFDESTQPVTYVFEQRYRVRIVR